MVGFSVFMMYGALILIGTLFWFRDVVTHNLPAAFIASDVVWAVSFFSLFFFRRYPWVTVVMAWTLFLTFLALFWPFQPSHTFAALLYNNGLQATYLVFAHVGWHFKRKTKAAPSR